MTKTRVLLALPDLQDLGVQHDVRCLMKHWDRDRFEPAMLVHSRTGAFADQFSADMRSVEVDALVPPIPKARVALRVAGYARAFREFRPHAVISFVPYANLACAIGRPMSRVKFGLAVSEHAHVTASMRDQESFQSTFLNVYRRTFPFVYNRMADVVKCIAEESRRDLVDNHGIAEPHSTLIYNPVDFDEVTHLAREPVDHPWFADDARSSVPVIVNVGRLCQQKRQEVLLEAFARVRAGHEAKLVFIGRGPRQELVERRARELGVERDVAFVGFQRNPWRFMARATMLAMSSEWEGLPCVLTEAMALGLPIVSTRCPSGPAEMLLEGRAGILVPVGDVARLAEGMRSIIVDPHAARERAAVATAHLNRFEPHAVTRQYEALAERLARISS